MKIVYQTNVDGFYIGTARAHNGLIPANAVEVEPTFKEDHIPKWNGESWEQVENHKGTKGYVDNKPFEVKEYGPLPEGFTLEREIPESEKLQNQINDLQRQLDEIDRKTTRPLRAKMSGKGTAKDDEVLSELEIQAEALRIEKADIENNLKNLMEV